MLVLARKSSESIVITTPEGEIVEICVLRVGPRNVKLGIQASASTRIIRGELNQETTYPEVEANVVQRQFVF
jgi:carbon storage regulator CsrA